MGGRDVLVVTQPPFEGGVPAKTRILCRHLRELGHRVTVAWYATFHHDADLNTPSWRLLRARAPGIRRQKCFGDFDGVAVGSVCPELEAPYYLDSPRWRDLVRSHDRHMAIGGPPLVGNPLAAAGIPFVLWCASDTLADRRDRMKRMSSLRRIVHDSITLPWLRGMERRVLGRASRALGVSSYTLDRLKGRGCQVERMAVMPIPVDCRLFAPPTDPAPAGILGFAARFEDPRKNLDMLLESVALMKAEGRSVRLRLAGAQPSERTLGRVAALGIGDHVEFLGDLTQAQLPDFYRSLDVFVLPSHQEGLCISGIEALATGVPVVSTPCGGPEDYVTECVTGRLCGFDPRSMADAVGQVVTDRQARAAMGAAGRRLAEDSYSHAAFARILAESWTMTWGEEP